MTEDYPDPTRTVADIDVLTADLLIGRDAREAIDLFRAHSWLSLLATVELLDEAHLVIETLTDTTLADDWREHIEQLVTVVEPTTRGHPALVAAAAGNAATILSLDDAFQSAAAGTALRSSLQASMKSPTAFLAIVDPADLYDTLYGDPYPGPDQHPRDLPLR